MKHQIHPLRYLWLVAVLLAGCQTLGIPQAQTFNQRVAAGYVTVTGITDGALLLGQAGKITVDDAQNVRDQAATLKTGLDIAKTLRITQPVAAEDRLSAILTGLNALDAYLASKSTP